jgi:hypothetical protein
MTTEILTRLANLSKEPEYSNFTFAMLSKAREAISELAQAELDRRAVTSAEVKRAIRLIENDVKFSLEQMYTIEYTKALRLAITALRQYEAKKSCNTCKHWYEAQGIGETSSCLLDCGECEYEAKGE